MKKPQLLLIGALANVLLLAGCTPSGGAPPEPAVTVTVTAAPAPTETPSPTPEPVARADFGFTYYHEADLSDTWDQMSAKLSKPIVPLSYCPWYAEVDSDYTSMIWTTALWDKDISTRGVTLFYTSTNSSNPDGPYPRNAEGVGVGSTMSQVLAAYPSAVVDTVTPFGESTVTRIVVNDPDSDSQYAFGITGDHGSDYVDRLQWGFGGAGGVWDHLCEGS